MAQEIREFAITVPAGTLKTAPLTTPIVFPERIVTDISWRVPPGPSGLMGWQLTSAGTPVIPIQQGTYMITDNQADSWPLAGYLDSGNWAVTAYNTGIYPHTLYLTFLLDLPGSGIPPVLPPAGQGIGVVGAGGSVDGGGSTSGTGGSSGATPADDSPSVVSVVLAAVLAQAAGLT